MLKCELATDLSFALEPSEMARALGLNPDPWQSSLLRSRANRILLNGCRQSGKSTVTALLAVHTAYYQPDSLVLLLSPSLRQSQELFRKALQLHHRLPSPMPSASESAFRLILKNGSRIVSLPGHESTIRGYSGVGLLAVDEASRVPKDLYFSVRPMLSVSKGRLLALSTPFGTRGWWYEAWKSSQKWERYEIPASKCPRIPKDFLEEERKIMGEWWFAQEYECRFLDAQTQAFRREDIERAFEENVTMWEI